MILCFLSMYRAPDMSDTSCIHGNHFSRIGGSTRSCTKTAPSRSFPDKGRTVLSINRRRHGCTPASANSYDFLEQTGRLLGIIYYGRHAKRKPKSPFPSSSDLRQLRKPTAQDFALSFQLPPRNTRSSESDVGGP